MNGFVPPEMLKQFRQNPIFAGLPEEQFARVVDTAEQVSLEIDEQLFAVGDPAKRFYMVLAGEVKLYRLSADGTEKVLEILRAGHLFAEATIFFDPQVYPVYAQAISKTSLASFDNDSYLGMLKGSAETCVSLLGAMSRRLHQKVMEIDNLTLQNATYRLVHYLLELSADGSVQGNNPGEVHLSSPKRVIASKLSVQPETLSRIFSQLIKKELIEVHQQNIILKDLMALRNILT